MRGKEDQSLTACICHRITPAYAGKSGYFGIYQYINGDHPRLCGEKRPFFLRDNPSVGSPPPMRGKVAKTADLTDSSRITPAYAGKSGAKNVGNRPSKDHPRLCGEKLILLHRQKSPAGSPPPMRGKGRLRQRRQHHRRITPAYAGKSFHDFLQKCQKWDHPRLCGEKQDGVRHPFQTEGSPPPMRGKVEEFIMKKIDVRITPAYAGKSFRGFPT